jgi:hypothetical protein
MKADFPHFVFLGSALFAVNGPTKTLVSAKTFL